MAAKDPKKTIIAVAEIRTGPGPKDKIEVGKSAQFPADEAESLVERGFAIWPGEESPNAPVAAAEPQPPAKEAERIGAIAEASVKLDKNEDFNAKGVPSLDALARVLGWRPSPEDRDKGFEKAKSASPDLFK